MGTINVVKDKAIGGTQTNQPFTYLLQNTENNQSEEQEREMKKQERRKRNHFKTRISAGGIDANFTPMSKNPTVKMI